MFFDLSQVWNLGHLQGIHFMGALPQKRWFQVNFYSFRSDFNVGWKKIKTNIQNSTINLSFDALSKWHDLDIRMRNTRGINSCLMSALYAIHGREQSNMSLHLSNWVNFSLTWSWIASFCTMLKKIPTVCKPFWRLFSTIWIELANVAPLSWTNSLWT